MLNVLSKLNEYMANGNFAKAEILLFDLLKSKPDNYNLNKNLGVALLAQKKYKGAIASFEKCYLLEKRDFDVLLNLSFISLKLQDYEHSIKFANEAIQINPDFAGVYQNLAGCQLELLQFEEAKKNANLAIKLLGGVGSEGLLQYPDLINLYADILLAKREGQDFVTFAEQILDSGIFMGELFSKLLKHDKSRIKSEYIEPVKKASVLLDQYKTNVDKNANVALANICLAEYYKSSDKKLSESLYVKANERIASIQRSSLYTHQKFYLKLIDYFGNFNDTAIKETIEPNKGEGLIFIIGMPRSGTTLTESILSTANDIKPGGERIFFPNNLWDVFLELEKDKLINPEYIDDLGNRYLEVIAKQRGEHKYFIDKLPANFLYYKFIQLCFPKAKFIHTFRNPWDNAISLFKANFQETITYSSSFFGIANYYANYLALIRFWKKQYGTNIFFEAEYENLVLNAEAVTKDMWAYCGLEGEFSQEKRKNHYAKTASQQQVSQDIYQTSLKKNEFSEFKLEFEDSLKQQEEFWLKRGI